MAKLRALPLWALLSSLALACLGWCADVAAADAAPASIEMWATPAQVEVGKPVTVSVVYHWAHGWSVDQQPDPSQAFEDQFVTFISPPRASVAGGTETRAFTLTVLPTASGAWTLPSPRLVVTGPGASRLEVAPAPVIVTVGRASADLQAPAPRPLARRPLVAVGHPYVWLGAGIALAIAVWVAVMVLMRRTRAAARLQSAHEALEETLAQALVQQDGKEAAALASLALRRFSGAIWRFDGPGSTARETVAMVRARADTEEFRELARLLDELDALRWAADDLKAQRLQPIIDAGRRWGGAVQSRLAAEAEAAMAAPKGRPGPVAVAS